MADRKFSLSWSHGGISYRISVTRGIGIVTARGSGVVRRGEFQHRPWLIHEFRQWNNAQRSEFALTVLQETAE